jgi:hypothetical protein
MVLPAPRHPAQPTPLLNCSQFNYGTSCQPGNAGRKTRHPAAPNQPGGRPRWRHNTYNHPRGRPTRSTTTRPRTLRHQSHTPAHCTTARTTSCQSPTRGPRADSNQLLQASRNPRRLRGSPRPPLWIARTHHHHPYSHRTTTPRPPTPTS